MGVVVLIGFSCTGKSTIVSSLENDVAFMQVQREDSDRRIAQDRGGHIYQIFIDLVHGPDRTAALQHIEERENDFLMTFQPEQNCVIAAGPILPLREGFPAFVARTNAILIWLTITPQTAAARLLSRQQGISAANPGLEDHANFGSWNEPHLTTYDPQENRYVLIENQSLREERTRTLIGNLEARYQQLAGRDRRFFVEQENRRESAIALLKYRVLN